MKSLFWKANGDLIYLDNENKNSKLIETFSDNNISINIGDSTFTLKENELCLNGECLSDVNINNLNEIADPGSAFKNIQYRDILNDQIGNNYISKY